MAEEYIKREDAVCICKKLRDKNLESDDMAFALNWSAEAISRVPATDVRPVVRAGG